MRAVLIPSLVNSKRRSGVTNIPRSGATVTPALKLALQ
jgi:hypothetical protein